MAARRRIRRLTVLLSVAALLAATPGPAGGAGSPARAGRDRVAAVTLLTGDKVLLREHGGGRRAVQVLPARRTGRAASFRVASVRGDAYVVPSDVRGLVGRLLDPALFNVSALLRMGYGDARADSLPLIVQHAAAARSATALAAASLRPVRLLGSLRATAVRQPRPAAARLGAALAATARSPRRAGPLAGVTRVWLDRRVHQTALDPNLTQIGAPAVWARGLNGKGVRVAVLDTGVDATHPDLKGKVVAAANFSESDTSTDRDGHGTHVASIVAGTGARAAGARRGVAFGASLLNGKVLDDFGFGTDSSVIAGMEWAARHRARIANLSLGGEPTDGSDPLSQALNRLTRGMLFVVAAGNAGPDDQTVSTPGSAAAALTVGAVDGADQLADFSSQGPRFGDYAMKPDITAPGVEIVAARATGTSLGEPVDRWYTRLSGTSMATPHVAGAAAVLAQRWPRWTPTRLKAVLMGTAAPHPELSVYQQGGGRLDVAHAVTQRLIARRSNLDFGYFRYPQTGVQPVTKPLTLANLGAAAVTVDLRLDLRGQDGNPAPAGTATVTPARLTVPAGGQASAQVTVDVQAGAPGLYSGGVTATPAAGPAVRTPLGFYKEPERYDLTLTAVGRDGRPAPFSDVGVMNVDDGALFQDFLFFDEDARLTIRVAPGHYHVVANVIGGAFDSIAMVGDPELEVTGDTSLTLDARRALPVTAAVEGVATTPVSVDLGYTRIDATGQYVLASSFEVGADLAGRLFAEPTEPVGHGQFESETRTRLIPAGVATPAASPLLYDLLFYGPAVPNPPAHLVTAEEAARLARVVARYRALNDQADYAEARIGFAPLQFFAVASSQPLSVPRTRLEYLSPDPIVWDQFALRFADDAFLDYFDFRVDPYRPGERVRTTWFTGPLRAAAFGERDATSMFLALTDFQDREGRFGDFFEFGEPPVSRAALRLFRDGRLLASTPDPFLQVAVPPGQAGYRLERDLDVDGLLSLANRSRTRWWFTSAAPPGEEFAGLPLLGVGYRAAPLDSRNGATAGRPVTLDLRVQRQEGAPQAEVVATSLWYSTDDGHAWLKVPLQQLGPGRYRGMLRMPRPALGRFVSLRVSARDAGGSRVDQTLLRAFPLR